MPTERRWQHNGRQERMYVDWCPLREGRWITVGQTHPDGLSLDPYVVAPKAVMVAIAHDILRLAGEENAD